VKEETGLQVTSARYLFSLPNIYPYSGFQVHTEDLFFLCTVRSDEHLLAQDDVAAARWIPLTEVRPEEFGLGSVRRGVERFLNEYKPEKTGTV
jgi:8-oxo-dGTP pyrophosphatase MutT (NUDIX family)